MQESDTVVFHLVPGDAVDVDRNEALNAWLADQLGVALPGKLQYYKYTSREHMYELTGHLANGRAFPPGLEVHSIFPFHSHETVHVFSYQAGAPSDFFNEGLAVALSADPLAGDFTPTYDGRTHVHDWARAQGGGLRPIAEIATTAAFRDIPESDGYQQAGSFVAYLVEQYGAPLVMQFFSVSTRDDALATIRANFRAIFQRGLDEAEADWYGFLGLG
ncbi:MAG: hypothetical protein R3244_00760 [Thermoanaerobaculia bacterium]|nr:hypothetical protein [Thermoanaerobaculia bacterium]